MNFDDFFKDKWFGFCGVCHNCFKLDDKVFEAIEDPCDGYRSYLGTIQLNSGEGLTFFDAPIVQVRIKERNGHDSEGFVLEDETGHVWLEVGTNYVDDYYPTFVFYYTPSKERIAQQELEQQVANSGINPKLMTLTKLLLG